MNFNIVNDDKIVIALKEINNEFSFDYSLTGVKTYVEYGYDRVNIKLKDMVLTIGVKKLSQVFWALKYVSDKFDQGDLHDFSIELTPKFDDLTYMMDCSRNAVYHVETVKTQIRQLAVAGYDSLMLYTEDTFKVDDYPYFGYLRTPYTEEDIKAIDQYCIMFGIELVPCIQTLAHFNSLIRHYAMDYLFDVNDILLVGEDNTYKFIESLISTCAKYFTSKRINIGMDEAYMLGRGRYLDKNGYRKRFDLMAEHLQKVCAICSKYGFKPMMWSDMFFSLTLSAQYGDNQLSQELTKLVPDTVELIYWDYCSTDKNHYYDMMQKHTVFNNQIGFAGGAWKWLGYTPDNRYAFVSMAEAGKACEMSSIKHYIVTAWGDNGADASTFSNMPSVYYAGYFNYIDYEINDEFKKSFKTYAQGTSFDDFMTVDLANRITTNDDVEEKNSANKYLLFNDILLGTLDTITVEGLGNLYKEHSKKILKAIKGGKWDYILKTQYYLCRVLEIKADIGIKLRRAYKEGDNTELAKLNRKLKTMLKRIEDFYKALRVQWDKEARPNGFDVQDIRIGGLKQRTKVAIDKITNYLNGNSTKIDELNEDLLCFMGHCNDFEKDFDQCEYRWLRMTSVNVNI